MYLLSYFSKYSSLCSNKWLSRVNLQNDSQYEADHNKDVSKDWHNRELLSGDFKVRERHLNSDILTESIYKDQGRSQSLILIPQVDFILTSLVEVRTLDTHAALLLTFAEWIKVILNQLGILTTHRVFVAVRIES